MNSHFPVTQLPQIPIPSPRASSSSSRSTLLGPPPFPWTGTVSCYSSAVPRLAQQLVRPVVGWRKGFGGECTRARAQGTPSGCRAGHSHWKSIELSRNTLLRDSVLGASFPGEPSRRGPARPMTGCPRVASHCQHPVLLGG